MLNNSLAKDVAPQHSIGFRDSVLNAYKNTRDLSLTVPGREGFKLYFPFLGVDSKLFGNKVISVPFFDVGGCCGSLSSKNLEQLKILFKESLFLQGNVQIKIDKSMNNFKVLRTFLLKCGFSESIDRQQFIVKFLTEDAMWKKFHKHTRNDIRMAQKSGVKLVRIENVSELKSFYEIYLREMRRFGTPQHSFLFFKELLEKKDISFLGYNCYYGNKVIATIINLYYGDKSSVLVNVSNPRFRKMRPNDMLYWESIKALIMRGVKTMDTGQVDLTHEMGSREWSLYKFKKKWLAVPYDRSVFTFSKNNTLPSTHETRKLKRFRILWSLMPLVLVRIFGPKIRSQLAL